MICLLRVDHRLLHGQVAFTWTQGVSADCILIANDRIVNDSLSKTTLKLAKPANTKLIFKSIEDSIVAINSGVTDSYRLLIVVESVIDAVNLVKGSAVLTSINLGGIKKKEGARAISQAVYLTQEEEDILKELIDSKGTEVEIRQVPSDEKILYKKYYI